MARGGVKIRGIFDAGQGNREWAATRMVADGGGEAWLASRKNGLGKLPHKLMVIDGAVIICGSFNYTAPANRLNDENTLAIRDPAHENPPAPAAHRALAPFSPAALDRQRDAPRDRVPLDGAR